MGDPYPPDVEPRDVDAWQDALLDAFFNRDPHPLELAEQALREFPGDAHILNLASVAALLEGRPERCLRFAKRLRRRYVFIDADHLLRALALSQQGRRGVAREILERHGLETLERAWPWLPGGHLLRPWLKEQLRDIRRQGPNEKTRARDRRARPAARDPVPATREPPSVPGAAGGEPEVPVLRRLRPDIAMRVEITGEDGGALAPPEKRAEVERAWFDLRTELAHLGMLQGFDELLCLPLLRQVETYWYQVETVRKVLKTFRGRVLLADEVGLGKTVEAGMVLKEYQLRAMVEQVLILTPASLVGQWREELASKFDIECATTHDPLLRRDPQRFWAQPRIIASIATARRKEHLTRLAVRPFDLVVVDEAHHLKNRSSASYKLVDALKKRFLLLLSATPVQNSLVELYNLLTLLEPGIFKTEKEFRNVYMTAGRPRMPVNRERLRDLMRGVMIRNTRALVDVRLPARHALTLRVDGGAEENACYRELGALLQEVHAAAPGGHRLALQHLLTAAGSSPRAGAAAIERFAGRHPGDPRWSRLAKRYDAIAAGAKENALLELLGRNPGEKKMVFVHHRATLAHLGSLLDQHGIDFARFDGSLSGPGKDAAIAAFRERLPVLLCSESGGEGRNIQFCNTLINFDLPWNPMAIEQRIGRIHRIGQKREVYVFNLVSRDTVEDRVLGILDEKINMFELVVGEIGEILGEMGEQRDFADLVFNAWVETSEHERGSAFAALGEDMVKARRRYEGVKQLDEELFGDEFETA